MQTPCTKCGKLIESTSPFCQFCGNSNELVELPIGFGEKVKVVVLSILLFPFGLYWFFRYFRSLNDAKRKLGYLSLVITLLVLLWFIVALTYIGRGLKDYTSSLWSELDTYSRLGY